MTQPRIERADDAEQALLSALAGLQTTIWTALPAIVRKVDLVRMTVEAEPTVQARFRQRDQTYEWVTMPVCVDCPIIFTGGGGYTLTFPVQPGDECLLIFSSRCIDGWWDSGAVATQSDLRMHDLSDGFALVGVRSRPKALPAINTGAVELRDDAGTTCVRLASGEVDIATPGAVRVTAATVDAAASSAAHVTAPTITLTGSVTISGSLAITGATTMANVTVAGDLAVAGALTNNGHTVGSTHRHGGVKSGSDTSGTPT